MNEATKELTLADFQQDIAFEYGNSDFETAIKKTEFMWQVEELFNKAANAYASYCREQGKQEGLVRHEFHVSSDLQWLKDRVYKKGWNEALKKVIEDVKETSEHSTYNKSVFLLYLKNNLKQEEE